MSFQMPWQKGHFVLYSGGEPVAYSVRECRWRIDQTNQGPTVVLEEGVMWKTHDSAEYEATLYSDDQVPVRTWNLGLVEPDHTLTVAR